jgi:hypothetical protein
VEIIPNQTILEEFLSRWSGRELPRRRESDGGSPLTWTAALSRTAALTWTAASTYPRTYPRTSPGRLGRRKMAGPADSLMVADHGESK